MLLLPFFGIRIIRRTFEDRLLLHARSIEIINITSFIYIYNISFINFFDRVRKRENKKLKTKKKQFWKNKIIINT